MALDYNAGLNLVLVEPEIPGNTGAVGRLCVGLEATLTLIEPLGFSLEDKYLRRAGLDYWPHLNWGTLPSLEALQEQIDDPSRFYYFTTKTDRPYTTPTYTRGDFLVFGKETKGLPASVREANAEQCVTLPIFGNIRSHNLAVAAGVAAYEAMRQITGGFPCVD